MLKKSIILVMTLIIFNFNLFSMMVPGKVFSGKIEKINKKERYIIVKKKKFYFNERLKKIIMKFYKNQKKLEFNFITKNGKRKIILIRKLQKRGGY